MSEALYPVLKLAEPAEGLDGRTFRVRSISPLILQLITVEIEEAWSECDECRKKPGTPILCAECLRDRARHPNP